MENQTFLKRLQEVFEQLKANRIVTNEDIERGIEIPLSCFGPTTKQEGLNREIMLQAIKNIHIRGYTSLKMFKTEHFKENSKLIYSEKEGVPYLESIFRYSFRTNESGTPGKKELKRKSSIIISDKRVNLSGQHEGAYRWVSSQQLISYILSAKKYCAKMEMENFLATHASRNE